MEKRKTKVLIAVGLICLLGLSYFLFSRYLVPKLDGTAGVTAPTGTISAGKPIHILFTGDVMLDRTVRTTIETRGFDHVVQGVRNIFEDIDLAIGNLEGSITENASVSQKDHDTLRFTFATSTAFELKKLGFTGFSLANNHALDFGEFGLEDTEHYLQHVGLYFFGSPFNERNLLSMPVVDGQKLCFLGYHSLFNSDNSSIIAELGRAKDFCDYTVVFAHWGVEYEHEPNESQRRAGRTFIDAGADLVIGAHPHVVQPVEIYKGKAIFYSLGNFIFDQDFSLATRQGLALRLELTKKSQKFHLIGIEMLRNRVYFPEKEAYKPSMDVIISELPAELKTEADVDSLLELPR